MLGNGRGRRASATLAALTVLVVGLTATAHAEVVEVGGQLSPPFTFSPSFSPRVVSRTEQTPVKLALASQFNPRPGFPQLPALSQIELLFDRHLDISTWGLPACAPRLQLELAGPGSVAERCKPALVGHGKTEIFLAFPESTGIPLTPKVFLYNGGTRTGVTRLWIYFQILIPVPTTILAPVDVKSIDEGAYGTEAFISLPKIASGYGVFDRLSLIFNREYTFKDQRRSVVTFRCANGKFQAVGEAVFADGTPSAALPVVRPCGVAG